MTRYVKKDSSRSARVNYSSKRNVMRAWYFVITFAALYINPASGVSAGSQHVFFREFDRVKGTRARGTHATRRVFGGSAASLQAFPAACALLDRYLSAVCSAAVLRAHWALTAGHCITPRLAFVRFNARKVTLAAGNIAAVHYRYRHPE